jgi:small GTP-binding protein
MSDFVDHFLSSPKNHSFNNECSRICNNQRLLFLTGLSLISLVRLFAKFLPIVGNFSFPTIRENDRLGRGRFSSVFPTNSGFKVTFLGLASVGKTSLIHAMLDSTLPEHYVPTVSGEMFATEVTCDSRIVPLLLWDTAGQERFNALAPMYLRSAHVAVIVFATDCPNSFAALNSLSKTVRDSAEGAACVIVANKVDLEDKRVITSEEGAAKASTLGMEYMETSAVSRIGVPDLLQTIALLAIEPSSVTVQTHPAPLEETGDSGCC